MALMLAEEVLAYNHFLFLLRCFCRSNLRSKADANAHLHQFTKGIGSTEFRGKFLRENFILRVQETETRLGDCTHRRIVMRSPGLADFRAVQYAVRENYREKTSAKSPQRNNRMFSQPGGLWA
jgi:hypothetical protein